MLHNRLYICTLVWSWVWLTNNCLSFLAHLIFRVHFPPRFPHGLKVILSSRNGSMPRFYRVDLYLTLDDPHALSFRANYTTPSVVLRRTKRDMSTLQLPGTQWCGRGYTAKDMTQLGGLTGTDNCCRYHDLGCPFYIEAFQEKYGLFNWRMYTINHCTCDER